MTPPSTLWNQERSGYTPWQLEEDGEYYHVDADGTYWSWSEWEPQQAFFSLGPEEQKEVADAYAAYESKVRSFTESRNLIHGKRKRAQGQE